MVFIGPTAYLKACPCSNIVTHLKQFQAWPVSFEMSCIETSAASLKSYPFCPSVRLARPSEAQVHLPKQSSPLA